MAPPLSPCLNMCLTPSHPCHSLCAESPAAAYSPKRIAGCRSQTQTTTTTARQGQGGRVRTGRQGQGGRGRMGRQRHGGAGAYGAPGARWGGCIRGARGTGWGRMGICVGVDMCCFLVVGLCWLVILDGAGSACPCLLWASLHSLYLWHAHYPAQYIMSISRMVAIHVHSIIWLQQGTPHYCSCPCGP